MATTPTLVEALRRALDARSSEICTAIPARVDSYDAAEQRCSVQPLIRRAFSDEAGERQVERLPVITGVPVVFPGAGAYSITWPLAKGDTVLLVFSQASIDKWLTSGREVDPLDDRRHSLNDAIAIPGLRSFGGVPAEGLHESALVIRAPEIHAGGNKALVTKEEFENHTHGRGTFAAGGDPVTGTSAAPSSITGTTVLKGG